MREISRARLCSRLGRDGLEQRAAVEALEELAAVRRLEPEEVDLGEAARHAADDQDRERHLDSV